MNFFHNIVTFLCYHWINFPFFSYLANDKTSEWLAKLKLISLGVITKQCQVILKKRLFWGNTLIKTISNWQLYRSSDPAATAGMCGGATVVKTMIELFGSYQEFQALVLMTRRKNLWRSKKIVHSWCSFLLSLVLFQVYPHLHTELAPINRIL